MTLGFIICISKFHQNVRPKKVITKTFNEVLEQTNPEQSEYDYLEDDLILLDSGLDSLGFAILVALLDEELDMILFKLWKNQFIQQLFMNF